MLEIAVDFSIIRGNVYSSFKLGNSVAHDY